MILDRIEMAEKYAALNPHLIKALGFLKRPDLKNLPIGRHEIDGQNSYAMVIRGQGRGRDKARLEAHRKYIDVQVVLSGVDEIGWKALDLCTSPDNPYDAEKDGLTFGDRPDAWVAVPAGSFAAFFPQDAHAPMGGSAGDIHKVVLKLAVE